MKTANVSKKLFAALLAVLMFIGMLPFGGAELHGTGGGRGSFAVPYGTFGLRAQIFFGRLHKRCNRYNV